MFFQFKSIAKCYAVLLLLFTLDGFALTSSNLPILVINTENQQIGDSERVPVKMGIIYNGIGKRNALTDKHNHFDGTIGLRLRGNSTQGFPKKPYDFTITDEKGDGKEVPLLGMASHEDWILLASYLDHTFIRTPLAGHMAQLADRWASHSRMVELVVDGKYQGIYLLIEKISRGKNRLGLEKLEPEQITYPDITGGYIFEISGQKDNLGSTRYLRYPEFDEAAPEQIEYIKNYDDQFRTAMKSRSYEKKYPQWIDVDTFVDELIVQEAMRNSDAYGWSSYFHKHRDGKLCAGPVWDFDQSAGNSSYPDDGVVEGWLYSHPSTSNRPFFWELLMADPAFKYKVKKRWQSLRQNEFKTENLLAYVDSLASLLSEAQAREFAQWPVLGANIWRETQGYAQRNTYKKEVNYLKEYLTARWDWMDSEIEQFDDFVSVDSYKESNGNHIVVYPNEVKSMATVEIVSTQAGKTTIQISSLLGKNVLPVLTANLATGINRVEIDFSGLEKGVYLYNIQTDNNNQFRGRLIKSE